MKIIVGLGNPGEKYHNTRHNLGFRVVEKLGKMLEGGVWKVDSRFKSEVINLSYSKKGISYIGEFANRFLNENTFPVKETEQILLAKPLTFMNNSGQAVKLLMDYFKVAPEDLIIIHDELDLALGKIKLKLGGGAAGHHGVESIISVLGTDQFTKVRLGISPEESISNAEQFVLENFLPQEHQGTKSMVYKATEAVKMILDKGLEAAQNKYH